MSPQQTAPPSRILIVAAFAALYLVWGSTYLAMKIAVETMPPWPMIAARQTLAGVLLFATLRLSGSPMPQRAHWKGGVIGGVLLLVIGNGLIAYASHRIPSGVTSMVAATTPIWMVMLASARANGRRPSGQEWSGLALGLVGLALLAGPSARAALHGDANGLDTGAVALVLTGTVSWAFGSVIGRDLPRPDNAFMGSALQMLSAAGILLVGCLVTGEWHTVDVRAISTRSWLAFFYLVFFGSLLGFTAYIWLLRVAKASHVSTYAYVNPIVALLLGASIGHELITSAMLLAAAVTLSGVVLVVMPSRSAVA
jgi:drug/metabolite transporter (DMT)-like permease